jgi:hypothetical protein
MKGDILNNSIGGEVKRVSVFGGQAFVKPLVYPILQVKVLSQGVRDVVDYVDFPFCGKGT